MKELIRKIKRFFNPPKRTGFCFVPYREAEKLLKEGWTIAREEDLNRCIGFVFLEKLEEQAP